MSGYSLHLNATAAMNTSDIIRNISMFDNTLIVTPTHNTKPRNNKK